MTSPISSNKQAPNAWKVLALLFLANMMNYFDRTIPAVIVEPMRLEFDLSDLQVGLVSAAFTIVYAIAGIPLGRLADTKPRKVILGWGLIAWSGFTALNALAWSYISFFMMRIGVGIGEASYAPAANSLLSDLFPSQKRAKAMGIFMLGLPVGLIAAFFTVGAAVEAFDSWRAPFVLAAIPGVIIGGMMFFIREPRRGASELEYTAKSIPNPIRTLLAIPTFRWIIASGITVNFASYSGAAFLVPLFQRYFGLPLMDASIATGVIVGLTGLIALPLGGWLADKVHQRWQRGRLILGAISLIIAAFLTGLALFIGQVSHLLFTAIFAIGWFAFYNYYTCTYTSIQDVVRPELRATAMGLYFACMYLLGGAFGPMAVGAMSDYFAQEVMQAGGELALTEAVKAIGLHSAMYLVPISFILTALFLALASRHFKNDRQS